MATVTLNLGAVEIGFPPGSGTATPDPAEEVVGDPPQWSDGSDATYAYVGKVFTPGVPSAVRAHAPADPVTGDLVSWTATVRASSDSAAPGSPATTQVRVLLLNVASGGFNTSADIEFPNDDAIHEVTVAGVVEDNPDGWMAAGPYVQVVVNTTFSRVTIYEVEVVVVTTTVEEPYTRLYPRKDERGPMGTGRRLVAAPIGRLYPIS